ncbi:MAG: hypothetical protein IJ150_05500, partial [Bacteroidales bacterium]|nr:hypothetical protein [Bacteroidales bacterium]
LYHNGQTVFSLPKVSLKQRIISLCGKNLNSDLIPVEIDTSIVKITGFTGKPQAAKKRNDKQYFFVNNRFMKNAYFNKAVLLAYEKLILPDTAPPYFLYFEVDPHTIDVNVHPTKTEINFENASDIFKLLQAGIRETLNKSDVAPAIDFENVEAVDLPYFSSKSEMPEMPKENFNPFYNPFNSTTRSFQETDKREKNNLENWQKLYSEDSLLTVSDEKMPIAVERKFLQIKEKYIVSPVKSGLMFINQFRAHFRVLYHKYLLEIDSNADGIQSLLYPETLSLEAQEVAMLYDLRDEFLAVGFDFNFDNFKAPVLKGIPPYLDKDRSMDVIFDILGCYKQEYGNIQSSIKDILAKSLSRNEAIKAGRKLSEKEMETLIDSLFATKEPNYSPDGKPTIVVVPIDEIEKKFL